MTWLSDLPSPVEPRAAYYTLHVPAGTYSANTLLGLLWEVFTHRLWHLYRYHDWRD